MVLKQFQKYKSQNNSDIFEIKKFNTIYYIAKYFSY